MTVTEKEYIDLLIAKLKENGCNVEEIDSLIDEKEILTLIPVILF